MEMKIYKRSLQALLSSAPRSRFLARLASLAQIGELARRLKLLILGGRLREVHLHLFQHCNFLFSLQVGKETAASSKDEILKQEMPLAFKRVEESSILLVEASQILRQDPYSSTARKKLIDGARGK